METVYIGEKFGSKIYFPIDRQEQLLLLVGRAGSGKTIVLETLHQYYINNNISSFLLNWNTPYYIPEDEFNSIICMFQLNNDISIDEHKYHIFERYNKQKTIINNLPVYSYNVMIDIFLFYIINSNKYSILIIDDIVVSPDQLVSCLQHNTNIKVIDAAHIINSTNPDTRKIINIEDCIKKRGLNI